MLFRSNEDRKSNHRFNRHLPINKLLILNGHMDKDSHENLLLHKDLLGDLMCQMDKLLPRHDRQLMVMQTSLEGHLLSKDGNLGLGGRLVQAHTLTRMHRLYRLYHKPSLLFDARRPRLRIASMCLTSRKQNEDYLKDLNSPLNDLHMLLSLSLPVSSAPRADLARYQCRIWRHRLLHTRNILEKLLYPIAMIRSQATIKILQLELRASTQAAP